MCTAEHAWPYRITSQIVELRVPPCLFGGIIYKRSRAGRTRSGQRGRATTNINICTHGGVAQKVGACCMQRIMQLSFLPQLGYDGGDHERSKCGPCVVSFRTGNFLQDQGPLFYFFLHKSKNNRLSIRTIRYHGTTHDAQ